MSKSLRRYTTRIFYFLLFYFFCDALHWFSVLLLWFQVYKGCGQPRLGKRSAGSEINFEGMKFDRGGSSGGGGGARPTTAAGTSLDRLVRDIKQKVHF